MSVLPDIAIRNKARSDRLIEPYHEGQLQPASYDVRLGSELLVPFSISKDPIDLREPVPDDIYERIDMSMGYVLRPREFVLGVTEERVNIPNGIVGRIEGKSSIGRLGLTAHVTAGYLDPGFCGRVTLEIVNLFPRQIRLRPGVFIAQLGFEYMAGPSKRPYGSPGLQSRYQGADDVQGSRHRRIDVSRGQ
jgi:dCTP deaminase